MDTVYTRCTKLYLPQYKVTPSDNYSDRIRGSHQTYDNDTDGESEHTKSYIAYKFSISLYFSAVTVSRKYRVAQKVSYHTLSISMSRPGKFLTESTGEKIVKIGQYLAKIWTKYDSLLFGPPCICYRTMH